MHAAVHFFALSMAYFFRRQQKEGEQISVLQRVYSDKPTRQTLYKHILPTAATAHRVYITMTGLESDISNSHNNHEDGDERKGARNVCRDILSS